MFLTFGFRIDSISVASESNSYKISLLKNHVLQKRLNMKHIH